jgi:penicillin V acylase-like amidase (Ntn superfamily)
MKTRIQYAISMLLLIGLLPVVVSPCTTFCIKDRTGNIYFGKNFDFYTGLGQIHINQRHLHKTSLTTPREKPLDWVAIYGSITFNQNGREFPYGGINEAGLVIEQMMLESDKAMYPRKDERFGLEELQWIQYQLDVAASVSEVIASGNRVRISDNSQAPIHFLVADAMGNTAVIENIAGRMVCHTGQDLVQAVSSNDTYDDSLEYYLKMDPQARENISNPNGRISTNDRFVRAAQMVRTFDSAKSKPIDYAFKILNNVSQGGTRWSIVYDLKNRAVLYRTSTNPKIRRLEMRLFDFSCSSRRLYIGIDQDLNTLSGFREYTPAANAELINRVWDQVEFLKAVPGEVRQAFIGYPQGVTCQGGK